MTILSNAQRGAVESAAGPVADLKAAILALDGLIQSGTATLASGTVTVAGVAITANSRIVLTMKDPGAGALTTFIALDVPAANRTVGVAGAGSFVVNAIDNAKAVLTTAVCTFDYLIVG